LPLIDAKARAYVIGHPRGSGLQISLHDSLLLDIDDRERLVHYRTPTDPGSSGSPVFTRQWEVMAVHHSGSSKTRRLHGEGTYEAAIRTRLSVSR
jgi:V8-like Glu-specific endopeptidase